MKVKATIINMPKSKLQDMQFEEWYKKYIEEWGGVDYHFTRNSIISDLESLDNNSNIRAFENGIKVRYNRTPVKSVEEDDFEDGLQATPLESAEIYIFDDGEIDYIHKGYSNTKLSCYSDVYNISDKEYDVSEITKELDKKLGKEYIESIGNRVQGEMIRRLLVQKKNALLKAVKRSIEKGEYKEEVKEFNPTDYNDGIPRLKK